MVAVAVVDLLEAIQVHIQNAHLAAVAMGVADRLLQPVVKQPPIGQSGERIVRGLFAQRRARALKLHHLRAYLHRLQAHVPQRAPGDQQRQGNRRDAECQREQKGALVSLLCLPLGGQVVL